MQKDTELRAACIALKFAYGGYFKGRCVLVVLHVSICGDTELSSYMLSNL